MPRYLLRGTPIPCFPPPFSRGGQGEGWGGMHTLHKAEKACNIFLCGAPRNGWSTPTGWSCSALLLMFHTLACKGSFAYIHPFLTFPYGTMPLVALRSLLVSVGPKEACWDS